jgi:2-polyprenyl-3-methyl-5-hydroxy-6-metoxy-1,4-benzoquinol methylase
MKKNRRDSTRELGLDIAVIFARYLFQTDHLHYGFWTNGLPVEMKNLKQAQEQYADFIISKIPVGVKTILDVGMGTGALARQLLATGYQVDCVSPSPALTAQARAHPGGECLTIFECRYEDLQTEKRYDLILFSESFQYIQLRTSLPVSDNHLTENGYILICDFFRKDTLERSPLGGGHSLLDFEQQLQAYPLLLLENEDITANTAPNIDLTNNFVEVVIRPVKDCLFGFLLKNYPTPTKILMWIFRKHLKQAEAKYFSGQRTGANFARFKSYRLFLFQRAANVAQPVSLTTI